MSISSHLPIIAKSTYEKPVMLRPGRARLSTKPCPSGSLTTENTIGIVLVACFNAATIGLLLATMRSGGELTTPAVRVRIRARSPAEN